MLDIMENKDSLPILSSVENGTLKITLNRPEKKNAINIPMYKKLLQLLRDSIQNETIYVTVVTGSGKFFCSGNDFSTSLLNQQEPIDVADSVAGFKEFVDALITYPKLLVAIVNGPAIGIAVTMLPLFDMVYASDKAYFHTPFTSLGLVAEGCSTYTFPRIFGKSKAGDMLYLGYKMGAVEAKRYGLISEVYELERLDKVWAYLKKFSELSSESILAIKLLVKRWDEKVLLEANAAEASELVNCVHSSDFVERFMNLMLRKSKMLDSFPRNIGRGRLSRSLDQRHLLSG